MFSKSSNPPPSITQEEMAEAANRGFREQLIGQALVGLASRTAAPMDHKVVDGMANDAINLADMIIRKLEDEKPLIDAPAPAPDQSDMAAEIKHLQAAFDTVDGLYREVEAENERLRVAVAPLVAIAEAFDANELDDEARKRWGKNYEHENTADPLSIVLYQGRGGGMLLNLADCLRAREALASTAPAKFSDGVVRAWVLSAYNLAVVGAARGEMIEYLEKALAATDPEPEPDPFQRKGMAEELAMCHRCFNDAPEPKGTIHGRLFKLYAMLGVNNFEDAKEVLRVWRASKQASEKARTRHE